jgi:hypothetical protein
LRRHGVEVLPAGRNTKRKGVRDEMEREPAGSARGAQRLSPSNARMGSGATRHNSAS